jgi:hypothetical protein
MEREQKQAVRDLIGAAEYAKEQLENARQYYPKSIKNSNKFNLENAIASLGKALYNAEKSGIKESIII